MMIPDGAGEGPMLQEATRELEAAIHDARVAIEAAVTALQAALAQTAAVGSPVPRTQAEG